MRINGFEQLKEFYKFVFHTEYEVRQSHISLYMFIFNQCNRASWAEWIKLPYDSAMVGACIGSKKTYYNALSDLEKFGLIEYKKGINNYKAPRIKLICLSTNEQLSVPLSEPQREQLSVPLPVPLTGKIYKLLTNNIKLITDNIEEVLEFLKKESNHIPTLEEVIDYFKKNNQDELTAKKAWEYYDESVKGTQKKYWRDKKGDKVINWKQKMRAVWFENEKKSVNWDKL